MSWSNVFSGVTDLVSEFITDPDKQAEISLKLQELEVEKDNLLLSTSTTPQTDAFVKILIAFKNVIIPMFRPLGSAIMAGFAGYCVLHEIMLPEYIQVMLFGAPVGWGYSRHKGKAKGKHHTKEADQDEFFE